MKSDSYKYYLSITFINILAVYKPVLDLMRKNTILEQYYGLTPTTFCLILGSLFVLPLLLQGVFSLFFDGKKVFRTIFLVLALLQFAGILTVKNNIQGYFLVVMYLILILNAFKDKFFKNFIWTLSVLSILLTLHTANKTYSGFSRDLFPLGWFDYGKYENEIKELSLKDDAPSNIIFIMLDGTDLTSDFLGEDMYPLPEKLPFLSKFSREDAQFFPNARSNSPQTFISIPNLLTGIREYKEAYKNSKEGRSLLHILAKHYKPNIFAYRGYYESFCAYENLACSPFNHDKKDLGLYNIIWRMYLYNISLNKIELPVKVKKFNPKKESYTFNDLISRIKTAKQGEKGLFYTHIFRRYKSQLIQFDHELSMLVDSLKEQGKYEDSLIIIMSDHGIVRSESEKTIEYGIRSLGPEEIVQVPIIVKFVGSKQTTLNTKYVENIDIYGTILSEVFSQDSSLFESDGQNLNSTNYKEVFENFFNCSSNGDLISSSKDSPFKVHLNEKCINVHDH